MLFLDINNMSIYSCKKNRLKKEKEIVFTYVFPFTSTAVTLYGLSFYVYVRRIVN